MIHRTAKEPRTARAVKAKIIFVLVLLLGAWVIPVRAGSMPHVERIVLPNNLVLLVSEEHSLPFVVFQMLVDAGSRLDPAGKEGLANLTAKGLLLGTARQNANAMNEALDFMGASLNSSAGQDYAAIELQVLKKDLEKGFGFFIDALMSPIFPEQEIQKEVIKILGAIQSADEQPMGLAEKTFRKTLFPQSPYGHPIEGTRESVSKLTRERDVLQFYRAFYRPNKAILAIVGDITVEEVKAKLISALAKWPANEVEAGAFNATYAKGPQTIKINRQITQANIVLGNVGVRRDNPDYYSLSVMNYILGGGGFGSRLTEEIRVKRGLAYSVVSFFGAEKYQGSFQIVMQTKNPSAREAIDLALKEMELIRKEPVSEGDLRRAKAYLIGSFPLRIDTQSKLANFLAQVEYHGLGLDYPERYPSLINSVSREGVLRVGRAYLHPEQVILVVVGNLKEAGMESPSTGP
ncbi:MAG TPA: pitrilysin family protein [Syntrophorhabdales bacterium]|nr:pitrilysin family protein [Syntrophorhabdales bacterium]